MPGQTSYDPRTYLNSSSQSKPFFSALSALMERSFETSLTRLHKALLWWRGDCRSFVIFSAFVQTCVLSKFGAV